MENRKEGDETVTLTKVWVLKVYPPAGERIASYAMTRRYRDERELAAAIIALPANARLALDWELE